MGVYIPNMNKPKCCADCHLVYEDWGYGRCCLTGDYTPDYDSDERLSNCPLKSTEEVISDFDDPDIQSFWKQTKALLRRTATSIS